MDSLVNMPLSFTVLLVIYFAITLAYSFKLKKIAVVDVITLASLYTIRIIAGAAAISVQLSFWLISFSIFIFLSLAFIKRYCELASKNPKTSSDGLYGRGYASTDKDIITSFGTSSGYLSVVVIALYINDPVTATLYKEPKIIWLVCPILLFWISRAWMIAHRGKMNDDPVVFALKDKTSILCLVSMLVLFIAAKYFTR